VGYFVFYIFLLAVALHAVPIRGVAVEEIGDNPVPYANISYISGKEISQCDDKGRFEFDLPSRNAVLVFKKTGYDSLVVELQDYADLLDIVVTMRSDAKHLGSATIVGGGEPIWENPRVAAMQKLEDAAGFRFDLVEHLSQMRGITGQMDFSGNLFYDGSRSEEIAYHLGELRIPNMRHLDIGFPGNLSVVNPHAINNININEHYGAGPFNQGLAGSIQFDPRNESDFKTSLSLGTALREIYMEGPWFFWEGFAFSARYLDPSTLKNMGEKFYTEFKKSNESCDNCTVSNPFKLSSMDIYARFFGRDSSYNRWALTGLYASDEYSIFQDTTAIIKGSQIYSLASAEYIGFNGTNMHVGVVSEEKSDILKDTSAFRKDGDKSLIDRYEKNSLTASLGISWEQTDNLGFALLYDFHNTSRKWVDFADFQNASLNDNVFQASTYYKIGGGNIRSAFGAGGIFSLSEKQILPLASFDIEKGDKKGFSIFGNTAWRSDWNDILDGNEIKGEIKGNALLKAGAEISLGGLSVSAHGFGRYYPDPTMPIPAAFEHYKEQQKSDYAWVYGSQITFEFHSMHKVAFQSNLGHVYGQYELPGGGQLPWQANSRLDMVSHLRIYPRSDSLLSLILSHRAGLDRPLYEWAITPSKNEGQIQGQRHIKYSNETGNLFRTDARLNLDLKSKVKFFFLENIRFFVEADNIFAPFNVQALRFLGGDNPRERSVAVRNNGDSDDGFDIVPFMARGMGFYWQFGVEGNFGL